MTHADAFRVFAELRMRTPAVTSKLVWVFVAPLLRFDMALPVSVYSVARALDTKTTTVRRALVHLDELGLIVCAEQPGSQTAGRFKLGPMAARLPAQS